MLHSLLTLLFTGPGKAIIVGSAGVWLIIVTGKFVGWADSRGYDDGYEPYEPFVRPYRPPLVGGDDLPEPPLPSLLFDEWKRLRQNQCAWCGSRFPSRVAGDPIPPSCQNCGGPR